MPSENIHSVDEQTLAPTGTRRISCLTSRAKNCKRLSRSPEKSEVRGSGEGNKHTPTHEVNCSSLEGLQIDWGKLNCNQQRWEQQPTSHQQSWQIGMVEANMAMYFRLWINRRMYVPAGFLMTTIWRTPVLHETITSEPFAL